MSVQYTLKPAPTPGQEGKFTAVVSSSYTLKFEDALNEVAERANCAEGTVYNIMSAYLDIIKRHFVNGATVYVGNLGRIYPSLTGSYDLPNATVDKSNLHINFTVAKPLAAELIANLSLERISSLPKEPLITTFHDMTMTAANVFTMGGIVSLVGDNLEFDENNPEEGVFLTPTGDSGLHRVESYGRHGAKNIDFALPSTFFTNYSAFSVVNETGLKITVISSYGTQTRHRKDYGTAIYEGAFGGTTRLVGFEGVTGSALLRAVKDDTGPGIKMTYTEAGTSSYGAAVAIAATATEETYTLPGHGTGNSLTVKVKGEKFYEYIASTGLVNGESINLAIYVI
jgi:hypothetical protein